MHGWFGKALVVWCVRSAGQTWTVRVRVPQGLCEPSLGTFTAKLQSVGVLERFRVGGGRTRLGL